MRSVGAVITIYNGNTSQIEVPAIRQTKPAKLASRPRAANIRLYHVWISRWMRIKCPPPDNWAKSKPTVLWQETNTPRWKAAVSHRTASLPVSEAWRRAAGAWWSWHPPKAAALRCPGRRDPLPLRAHHRDPTRTRRPGAPSSASVGQGCGCCCCRSSPGECVKFRWC